MSQYMLESMMPSMSRMTPTPYHCTTATKFYYWMHAPITQWISVLLPAVLMAVRAKEIEL
jgi:hypothetical protein